MVNCQGRSEVGASSLLPHEDSTLVAPRESTSGPFIPAGIHESEKNTKFAQAVSALVRLSPPTSLPFVARHGNEQCG